MKEFENDNWELKARQLSDAFQPAPDESVWVNVEAALKQKNNHKGIFFWLFSFIGIVFVVYGGVTLYLLNAGDQYDSLNKQFEKSKVETVAVINNSSEVVESVPTVTAQKTEQVASVKTITENSPSKSQEQKVIPSKKQVQVVELKTVTKKNEMEEKPDLIVTELQNEKVIQKISAGSFEGLELNIIEIPFLKRTISTYTISMGDPVFVPYSHWMLLVSTSYLIQHSVLKSTDTLQTFDKQNANYIDGSLHLIYQFQKARNLELNFGLGFYELNQNYTESKYLKFTSYDTTGTALVSYDKLNESKSGSEFSRSAFIDLGIGIPIVVCRNFSWNISTGIRTEYLMKYSSTSGVTIPNTFGNLGLQYMESISTNEQNRFYLKGKFNTSVRYSLSKHFAFQSGINTSYSITDRYKRSSSLHQRDLNLGLNAGVIYRF